MMMGTTVAIIAGHQAMTIRNRHIGDDNIHVGDKNNDDY
jgi:hypothetical protein